MKILTSVVLAGTLALGLATEAQAQSAAIPTPVNPNPAFPVATNGTPLPRTYFNDNGAVFSGRSAYVGGPLGGIVGTGLDTATGLVGTGVGIAGGAVDTGLGTAGAVVDGTAGQVVR